MSATADRSPAGRPRGITPLLVVVCLAQFMVILDVSIVNVALPSIRGSLHFSTAGLQWVVNAYTLTFAGFLMLGGRFADLLGRRRVFLTGTVLFAAASLLCSVAASRGMLIAARGLQGFGGAVLSPATLSIVSSSFREGPERNRALGLWGAMGALGGSSGALLGGLLTQLLGWSSIFAINVPLGAIVLALGWRLVPRGGELPSRRHFDLLGAVLITTSLVCVTYAIVHTDTSGWGSLGVDAPLGAGLALLAAFAYVEGRVARAPLIPLSALRVGRLRAANLVVLLLYGGFFPVWFFLTIYLQQVRHLDAIEAGLAFVPMTGSIFLASTLAPRVVGRWGARPVIAAGMATAGLGMLLLSGLAPGGTYAGAVLPGALLSALGMGFSLVPATIVAMQGLPKDLSGLGSGLLNTSRLMGGALGLAILSTIADSRTGAAAHSVGAAQALTDGFGLAFLVGAGFAFAGTVVAATLLGSRRGAPGAPAAADLDAPHEPVAGAGEQEPLAA